ncbi:MAG TPA: arginine--tRNA ligase, partial [Chitinophagaceae bacterium]|nr:arginine--tRNA ligase [Chitinophagaceae bacterium]
MSIVKEIKPLIAAVLKDHYGFSTGETDLTINTTKPEFEGDYTLVLFSYVKQLKKSPEQLGNEIGDALIKAHPQLFVAYNVIKGFLNLTISDDYWRQFLKTNYNNQQFGFGQSKNQKVMVEYSSPNTNKPLHLGHLRNIFLGWSIAEILNRSGYETVKSCVVNDRGIHICKSMIAWQLFANGATPESTATKGDHFVGEYYVKFNDAYKQQVDELVAK